jgi:hypothetical protein
VPRQYFRGLLQDPQPAAYPTITAITETVLVPTLFTPIPAGTISPGSVYKLTVMGTITTGLTGTMLLTPRLGTVIGGIALGASGAQTYVASVTLAPFLFQYWLSFPSIGQAGTNGTAVGFGCWESGGAVATAGSSFSVQCSSTASVAVDTTIVQALWIGVTVSVAPSIIPRIAIWESV